MDLPDDVPQLDCSGLDALTCHQTPGCSFDYGCCAYGAPAICVPAGTPLHERGCPDVPCGFDVAPSDPGDAGAELDAGADLGDAGDLGDGPDVMTADAAGGGLPCVQTTCDPTAEYCYHMSVGPDSGVPMGSCRPLPAACTTDPTCACLSSATPPICITSCTEGRPGVDVRCEQP
jgi:hypothetical protein